MTLAMRRHARPPRPLKAPQARRHCQLVPTPRASLHLRQPMRRRSLAMLRRVCPQRRWHRRKAWQASLLGQREQPALVDLSRRGLMLHQSCVMLSHVSRPCPQRRHEILLPCLLCSPEEAPAVDLSRRLMRRESRLLQACLSPRKVRQRRLPLSPLRHLQPRRGNGPRSFCKLSPAWRARSTLPWHDRSGDRAALPCS
jgi:hypothetical protein